MSKKWLFLSSILLLLTSCSYVNNQYCKYNNRCNEYQQYTPCGSYLKHPCDNICDNCKFNEADCKFCWACINQNTCQSEICNKVY